MLVCPCRFRLNFLSTYNSDTNVHTIRLCSSISTLSSYNAGVSVGQGNMHLGLLRAKSMVNNFNQFKNEATGMNLTPEMFPFSKPLPGGRSEEYKSHLYMFRNSIVQCRQCCFFSVTVGWAFCITNHPNTHTHMCALYSVYAKIENVWHH